MAYLASHTSTNSAVSGQPDFNEALSRLTRFAKRISFDDNVVYQDLLKTASQQPGPTLAQASSALDHLASRIYSHIGSLEKTLGM